MLNGCNALVLTKIPLSKDIWSAATLPEKRL